MRAKEFLLLLGVLTIGWFQCISARGSRGGGIRFSSRYSSYRYSTYRYSSYRSSSTYRSFSTSNYAMSPVVLGRKGGFSGNKQLLFVAGSVYVAHKMRPKFHISGSGYRYYGDYDEFAVCSRNFTAFNSANLTATYNYFVCPTDFRGLFRSDDKYCCGSLWNQYCCDEKAFYLMYGEPLSAAVSAVVIVVVIGGILASCCCCSLIVYCAFKRRMQRYEQPVPPPTGGAVVQVGAAYPLQPVMQEPPEVAYEKQPLQPGGEGAPYPGADGAMPPYPMYPPGQQQQLMPQPPPYPGPV